MFPEPSKAGSTLHTHIRLQEFFKLSGHFFPFSLWLFVSHQALCRYHWWNTPFHRHTHTGVFGTRVEDTHDSTESTLRVSLCVTSKQKKIWLLKCFSESFKESHWTLSVFINVLVLALSTAGKWHNEVFWKKPEDKDYTEFFVKYHRIAMKKGISLQPAKVVWVFNMVLRSPAENFERHVVILL